jgi:hypothetical protein
VCEALELRFDPESPMCSSCNDGECYGTVFQKVTSMSLECNLHCNHCPYTTEDIQKHCFSRVEPHFNTETSICMSLQETEIPSSKCEVCGGVGAQQQIAIDDLPPFAVVHIDKTAAVASGLPVEVSVRNSGIDFNRFAAAHRTGDAPKRGHYTATVATKTTAYYCDDSTIAAWPGLCDAARSNAYLIFLQNPSSGDAALRGGQHPALSTAASSEEGPAQKENLATSIAGSADACAENCAKGAGDPSTELTDTQNEEDVEGDGEDDADADSSTLEDGGQCTMQPAECRVTSTGHDDWLHRGPFLADFPWEAYMMRVRRVRKPAWASADYTECFFFDAHYALSALYCQQLEYANRDAIPRAVGSMCLPERENEGESHATYKLKFFSRSRCPGPGACGSVVDLESSKLKIEIEY